MRFLPFALVVLAAGGDAPAPKSNPREGLQPLGVLIGSWKGTGYPEGVSKDERAVGMWTETITWSWAFKGDDAWLTARFEKGKHFDRGELRFSNDRNAPFRLTLTTPDKLTRQYSGNLADKTLTFTRTDGPAGEEQRLVFSLLHSNRYLYRFESRPAGSVVAFAKKYQIGATKEGVPFADVPKGPECVVSGGLGTSKVSYMGKDYYVCCSGCRDEFKANPEKYVKEAERKAKDGK
ncbi:MAG TPA: YHS domain-containing protein [Urbifossiella sp.]|nr:YHS domain-containing protein [Urbifossiella sp.]